MKAAARTTMQRSWPHALLTAAGTIALLASGCTGDIAGSADTGGASTVGMTPGSGPAMVGSRPPNGGVPVAGNNGSTTNPGTLPAVEDHPDFTSTDYLWDLSKGFACQTDRGGIRSAFRQLTRAEYRNTIRDLLGIETELGNGITGDEKSSFFAANSISSIQQIEVEKYGFAAASLAKQAIEEKLSSLLPCDPGAGAACARQFIEKFGLRAFRRPLEASEVDYYADKLFAPMAASGTFNDGIQLVIEAMLQSPFFVYHLELGTGGAADTPSPLSDYELASRLSYFLWATMPDEALFASAAAGKLTSGADLQAQVDRLATDPRAKLVVRSYFSQWLDVDHVLEVDEEALSSSLVALIDSIWDGHGGKFGELLTTSTSFVNQEIAPYFGVTVKGTALQPVKMQDGQRLGILTQPGVLAAHGGDMWPIYRGIMVRERLMCHNVEPPGQAIPEVVVEPASKETLREMLARHSADPGCNACHQNFDPIGYTFAHFDGEGRYRTLEAGKPVNAMGGIANSADMDGPINGVTELVNKLTSSKEVEACVTRTVFRFAMGRTEARADGCALGRMHEGFQKSGGSIRELMRSIAMSKEFRTNLR